MWDEEGFYRFEEMDQNYRTPLDLAIEMGWRFYQDAICPKCGVPWWYGRSDDNRVQFDLQENVCYSCVEVERSNDDRSKKKNASKRYGTTDVVVPVGVKFVEGESVPLPTPFELMG